MVTARDGILQQTVTVCRCEEQPSVSPLSYNIEYDRGEAEGCSSHLRTMSVCCKIPSRTVTVCTYLHTVTFGDL